MHADASPVRAVLQGTAHDRPDNDCLALDAADPLAPLRAHSTCPTA